MDRERGIDFFVSEIFLFTSSSSVKFTDFCSSFSRSQSDLLGSAGSIKAVCKSFMFSKT